MALVVDAKGRVTAPSGSSPRPSGVGPQALLNDLGSLAFRDPGHATYQAPGTVPVRQQLEQAAQQSQSQAPILPSPSVPTSPYPIAIPSVSVAQMPSSTPMPGLDFNIVPSQPMSSSPPIGLSGSSGSENPTERIDADQLLMKDPNGVSGLDAWEADMAEEQQRPIITTNLFGEEFDDEEKPFGSFDNQINLIGNTRTNDAYLRDLVDSGRLSKGEAKTFMTDPSERLKHLDEWRDDEDIDVDKLLTRKDGDKFSNTALDDGLHDDWMSVTADAMTGTQYLHYRDDLGMGGRENIDPAAKYSKREESVNYDFKPFTPHAQDYLSGVARNVMSIPAKIGDVISDARRWLTPDYEIEFGPEDDRKKISGDSFDRDSTAFVNRYYYDMMHDKGKFLTKPEDGTPYEGIVKQFEVPDVDGNPTYHYGLHVETSEMPDGTYQLAFSDGSTVRTTPEFIDSVKSTGLHYDQVPLSVAKSIIDEDQLLDRNKYQYLVDEYVIPDAYTGEDTYHYVSPAENGFTQNEDGTFSLQFVDGSVANLSREWIEQNLNENGQFIPQPTNRVFADNANTDIYHEETDAPGLVIKPVEETDPDRAKLYDDPETSPLAYFPSMVMEDGTVLNSADVLKLYYDKTAGNDPNENINDDDISYKFQGIGGNLPIIGDFLGGLDIVTNKPSRLGNQEVFENGDITKFNPADLGNNLFDWTAGSAPISLPGPASWIYSASSAIDSLEGGNPGMRNYMNGSESLQRGGYDENGNLFSGVVDENGERDNEKSELAKLASFYGNMTVPLTEQLVGPIGEGIAPVRKALDKFMPTNSSTRQWLRNLLVGGIEEGIEENLGNIPEEFTQYGPDMYATPATDKNGQPLKDLYGNEVRVDTPDVTRASRMANDVFTDPNAFIGGLGVSTVMQALPKPPRVLSDRVPMLRSLGNGLVMGRREPYVDQNGDIKYTDPGLIQALREDVIRHRLGLDAYNPADINVNDYKDLGDEYASLFDNIVIDGETEDDVKERNKWRQTSDLIPEVNMK